MGLLVGLLGLVCPVSSMNENAFAFMLTCACSLFFLDGALYLTNLDRSAVFSSLGMDLTLCTVLSWLLVDLNACFVMFLEC